jgi:Zn-dependent protease
MHWSWKVARVRGIDIRIHAAFLLLLLWIGGSTWLAGDLTEALAGVGFILLVFVIVVLHELGHALTAAHYGIGTRDITLLPIGGVARLERMPEEPRAELTIALAGPAVNVVLALVFAGIAMLMDLPFSPPDGALEPEALPLITRLVWLNVALAVFNLLPAFPMDGGRVLRAILAMRLDRRRATHLAASVGQGIALLLGFLGLYGNPLLVIIAVFVWLGARSESNVEDLRAAIRGLHVADAMVKHFEVLGERDTLASVSAHVVSGFQNQFPVVDDGRVIGLLSHSDLVRGLSEGGPETMVAAVMRPLPLALEASMPLEDALEQLERTASALLPVLDRGRLVGIVTLESLGELLTMSTAVEMNRRRAGRTPSLPAAVAPALLLLALFGGAACHANDAPRSPGADDEWYGDPDSWVGRELYTLTNLHPDASRHRLYSINYQRSGFIPICSRVHISEATSSRIWFIAFGVQYEYRLRDEYMIEGRDAHLRRYFGEQCDRGDTLSAEDQAGIAAGTVSAGMTRAGVIKAIGYPPPHATPDLEAPQWRYWRSRFDTFLVQFENGRVAWVRD